jgi:hypothetical protein
VLYNRQFELPQAHPPIRHRCRNPRCGARLKPAVTNPRDAFCCDGCVVAFFRNRCRVCEADLPPGPINRKVCWRRKCRQEARKFPHLYLDAKSVKRPPRSAHSTGLKIGTKSGRGFTQIAGPELTPASLRLASLPLDPKTAVRVRRANAWAWVDTTKIPTPSWPVILVGGSDYGHELVCRRQEKKTP